MFSASIVYGQEKKIKKAIEALNENNYTEYNSLLNGYVKEAPEVPLAAYALSLGYTKPGSPSYDLEKGFKKLQSVKDWLSSNESDKGWCKSFGLCTENIHAQIDSIAITALRQVEQNKTDESYQKFIKVYTNTPINDKAILSYHHWKFELASSANTVESLESFIKQFPNAQDIPKAKKKLEELEYNKCKVSNDIPSIDAFIKKYPNSEGKNELQQLIFDLEYKKCISSNDKNCFTDFEKKYPNSKYSSEIKNRIEEIDFSNAKKSSSKEVLEAFISDYPNSKYLEEAKKKLRGMNVESIIATGSGRTKDLAISNCIFGATRLLSNMFLSSEIIVQNENLINETIKQISSGEILDYEIVNERTLEDTLFETTLKLTFRLDTLSGFFKSKGMSLNFDRSSFTYKIKNQKIKERQEIEIIYDLIGNLNEGLQTSFEYKLQASTPVKTSITPLEWKVPLKIIVLPNENFKNNFKLFLKTLETLSLTEKEIEEYKTYKKEIYPIKLNSAKELNSKREIDDVSSEEENQKSIEHIYYFRNRNSLKAINFLFSNYFNFLTSFHITCEIDTLYGHNIEPEYEWGKVKHYYYLSDPTLIRSEISNYEKYKEIVNTVNDASVHERNLDEFKIPIIYINPLTSYFRNLNNYTIDNPIYEIDLMNLLESDTLALINLNHLVKLNELKFISNYTIRSNGLVFKYRDKGMYVDIGKKNQTILLLNYFDKLRFNLIDSTFEQQPFSELSNLRIPNENEFQKIYSLPFYKLLILPNFSWCTGKNTCYTDNSYVYHCDMDRFGDYSIFKRYHGTTCSENAKANNVVLIYDK